MIDIILFILITLFLLRKINIVIGFRNSSDFFNEKEVKKDIESIDLQLDKNELDQDRVSFLRDNDLSIFKNCFSDSFINNELKVQKLLDIYQKDSTFDVKKFIDHVKSFIQDILEKYSEKDKKSLSEFMSDTFLNRLSLKFEESLTEIIVPISIKSVLINDILDSSTIFVYIEMDQIIYSVNQDGSVFSGSKTKTNRVLEIWKLIKFNEKWILDGIKDQAL